MTDFDVLRILNEIVRQSTLPVVGLAHATRVPLSVLVDILAALEKRQIVRWQGKDSKSAGLVSATPLAREERNRLAHETVPQSPETASRVG